VRRARRPTVGPASPRTLAVRLAPPRTSLFVVRGSVTAGPGRSRAATLHFSGRAGAALAPSLLLRTNACHAGLIVYQGSSTASAVQRGRALSGNFALGYRLAAPHALVVWLPASATPNAATHRAIRRAFASCLLALTQHRLWLAPPCLRSRRRLTWRSRRGPTASHQARPAGLRIIRRAGLAPCRWPRLSSTLGFNHARPRCRH
jgi:hypothetical protein